MVLTCDVQVGVLKHERRPRIHPERLAAAQVEVDRQRDVGSRVYALLTGVVLRRAVPTQEALELEIVSKLILSQRRRSLRERGQRTSPLRTRAARITAPRDALGYPLVGQRRWTRGVRFGREPEVRPHPRRVIGGLPVLESTLVYALEAVDEILDARAQAQVLGGPSAARHRADHRSASSAFSTSSSCTAIRRSLIADVFHRTGLVEKWGRGTNRVAELCKAAGIAPPEFEEITGAAVVTFRVPVAGAKLGKPESQPESQPESRPESAPLAVRVLLALEPVALGKSGISAALGQREISGPLNAAIRQLKADRMIESTIPDKPNSRLQKYRLTVAGRAAVVQVRGR